MNEIREQYNKLCTFLVEQNYIWENGRLTEAGLDYINDQYLGRGLCCWCELFNEENVWVPGANSGEVYEKEEIISLGYNVWGYLKYNQLLKEHLINLCNFFDISTNILYDNGLETFGEDDMLDI